MNRETTINDTPLTAEEIAQGEANRRKPMTADDLALIERDLPRYAEGKIDEADMFLCACMLLREVKRLRA